MDVGHSDLNTAVPLDEDLNNDLVILGNSLDDSTREECQQQRTQGSPEMNKNQLDCTVRQQRLKE